MNENSVKALAGAVAEERRSEALKYGDADQGSALRDSGSLRVSIRRFLELVGPHSLIGCALGAPFGRTHAAEDCQ